MDTLEYRRIISSLDKELEQAKKAWEEKARREVLEQKKRLILHWQEGLKARQAEFVKYCAKPSLDIEAELSKLQAEAMEIEQQLAGKEPASPPPPPRLDPEVRRDLDLLMDYITDTVKDGLPERPHIERVFYLQIWSIRWRILAIKAGDYLVRMEGSPFKAAYAKIMWARATTGTDLRMDALAPDCHQDVEKWDGELRDLGQRLNAIVTAREEEDRQAKLVEDAFYELFAFVQGAPIAGDDAINLFRHLTRKAASFTHMRPEIAALCKEKKEILGEEFGFLWPEDGEPKEEPEEPGKKLSNREIAARICRRLKAKGMFGASHAPQDVVVRGFAGHDYGRAEEALEALVRSGIIRRRKTGIGMRLSLEPAKMKEYEAAIEGKPTGAAALDQWTAKEA